MTARQIENLVLASAVSALVAYLVTRYLDSRLNTQR